MVYKQLWLDCDGVLANFDKRATEIFGMNPREFEKLNGSKAFWDTLYATKDLFYSLEPMEDAFELYDAVKHLRPIILTGCPRGTWAYGQKFRWRDKHFPGVPMVCTKSEFKSHYCHPGDVLVDDWTRYKTNWENAGGTFVVHTSAEESIRQLKDIGVL
ncbi:hypothetical protein [Caulobacter phage Cr30]|uniref:hypothetical protein n=1 Tax=Caulobacter phage Cr30 TaxID=1357714 RepID=UPI0004A9B9BE|nr:hypothetical protein OZ74_gp045 [Caulobacter phage Cr30]AGS80930.1 hypothetical protein [Caulobacter phage Cr30]